MECLQLFSALTPFKFYLLHFILFQSFPPNYRVLDLFMFRVPSLVNFDGTPALISGTRAWPQGPRPLLMVALGLLCSTSETEWLGSYSWDKLVNKS